MDAAAAGAVMRAGVPCEVTLADRRAVTVAAARARDGDALALLVGRCGTATSLGRWATAVPHPDRAWLRRLLGTQVALCAWDRRRMVGLANLSPRDGAAAAAVVVEDAYQGRGLGAALAGLLAEVAALLGYPALVAATPVDAAAGRRLLARLGREETLTGADGTSLAAVRLPGPRPVTTPASPR